MRLEILACVEAGQSEAELIGSEMEASVNLCLLVGEKHVGWLGGFLWVTVTAGGPSGSAFDDRHCFVNL